MKKVSSLALECYAKKDVPGPINKYKISYRLTEPRQPFTAIVDKQLGRDNKAIPDKAQMDPRP